MTELLEAIQALPPIPTARPLNDEPTRVWLKEHGFDLSRWIAWWDQKSEAGTVCRHFRQDVKIDPATRLAGHGI